MGKLVDVNIDNIYPTEDDLSLSSFLQILSVPNYSNQLPIIARNLEGSHFILDGRHRSLRDYLNGAEHLRVYVPDNENDFLTRNQFPNISLEQISETNNLLKSRWDEAPISSANLGLMPLPKFFKERILPSRPYMTSLIDCLNYCQEERPMLYEIIFEE